MKFTIKKIIENELYAVILSGWKKDNQLHAEFSRGSMGVYYSDEIYQPCLDLYFSNKYIWRNYDFADPKIKIKEDEQIAFFIITVHIPGRI